MDSSVEPASRSAARCGRTSVQPSDSRERMYLGHGSLGALATSESHSRRCVATRYLKDRQFLLKTSAAARYFQHALGPNSEFQKV